MQRSYAFIGGIVIVASAILVIYAIAALSPVNVNRGLVNDAWAEYPPLDKPTVSFGNPARGPREAPLTIIEFGDYECAPCAEIEAAIAYVLAAHPNDVRLVWKDFPNAGLHPDAAKAAAAARCAGEQGAFWEYHDLILQNYHSLSASNLLPFAASLGLDVAAFEDCLASGRMDGFVERDLIEGLRLRVDATPYLFIGSRRISGALEPEQLLGLVESELDAIKRGMDQPPSDAAAPLPPPSQ